jgi:UDP-N-acetylglucosamine 2-epimerase (non-hydrolysing)/GDP/UDP-N,N'-diacetylbacillosamine 2-epimerase (hydrolysing)
MSTKETRKKICVVTGTRAEYGLLYWLMKDIEADSGLQLQLLVTGMHLSPEFGLTYRKIEEDGFRIDSKVEMLLSSDTAVGVAKSIGLGVIGFADALARLEPDLLLVLGDRFEILAAVEAAMIARTPVAHIAGGDVTEGAFDESIRHSITKMSHLHFVTNAGSGRRVVQMGENPAHVYPVGNPGLDHIHRTRLLSRGELEQELDFEFREKNLLITFHPSTLTEEDAGKQFQNLLRALDSLGGDVGLIFTYPNADPQGRELIRILEEFLVGRPNTRGYKSLGQQRYLSLLAQVNAVVGNSSSGLYEAPSFKIPTVNIGDRQKGRLRAASVLDCGSAEQEIRSALERAWTMDCSQVVNPYGDGHSSEKILRFLKQIDDYRTLLQKPFFELEY